MGFRHVFGVEDLGDLGFGEELLLAGESYDALAGGDGFFGDAALAYPI